MKKESIRVIIILCAALVVLCTVRFFAIAFVVPALLCDRDIKSPQVIDISPLENLAWQPGTNSITDLLDLTIFDSYEILDSRFVTGQCIWEEGSDYSHIDVKLILFDSVEQAGQLFRDNCEHLWYEPDLFDFTFGGSDNNQFCISYVKEARAGPEGLCRPLGYYYSYVVFQKGNLLITIHERTSDQASTRKDEVIKQLAQELGE